MAGKFVTAINCMDGRTQLPVNEYLRKEYGADYVDTITEAGPDDILAKKGEENECIRKRVSISVKKHGSRLIAIVGHYDCAGNPVNEETHKREILESVEMLSRWFPRLEVIGLWVDGNWKVVRI